MLPQDMNNRLWSKVDEFPDYSFSDRGDVWNQISNKVISPSKVNGTGFKVNLRRDGRNCVRSLSTMVCRAFHGEPEKDHVVIFRDNDQTNCQADNLYWGTRSQAYDRLRQSKRNGVPLRTIPVMHLETGKVYSNTLEAANAVDGIEEYIVVAAADPKFAFYRGQWTWVKG